eukprot:m.20968 g.20968  ORF g.20968 m.20968 type:complete len:133 (-) comp5638_c0_seq1:108-506(-)
MERREARSLGIHRGGGAGEDPGHSEQRALRGGDVQPSSHGRVVVAAPRVVYPTARESIRVRVAKAERTQILVLFRRSSKLFGLCSFSHHTPTQEVNLKPRNQVRQSQLRPHRFWHSTRLSGGLLGLRNTSVP